MKLNLTLAVKNLDVSHYFYRDILGLSLKHTQGHEYFIINFTNIKIVFQLVARMEQQHPALLQHLSRSSLGVGLQLELDCPNLNGVATRLEQAQWPTVYELEDKEHKRREFWVQDPDGYLLVLNEERE